MWYPKMKKIKIKTTTIWVINPQKQPPAVSACTFTTKGWSPDTVPTTHRRLHQQLAHDGEHAGQADRGAHCGEMADSAYCEHTDRQPSCRTEPDRLSGSSVAASDSRCLSEAPQPAPEGWRGCFLYLTRDRWRLQTEDMRSSSSWMISIFTYKKLKKTN